MATNQPQALSNLVTQTTGISVSVPATNDPVAIELKKIEDDDDAALAEVDGWIRENMEFEAKGAGIPREELNRKIRNRLETVRQAYNEFVKKHPDYAKARVAYASFLSDIGDEDGEVEQLEKAKELDPSDPATWNNLANYYGHNGPVTNAFVDYEKAIQLDPTEPVYYHNFGTTVYLFRKDVKEYYHITNEQQVFDKALGLYSNAMKYDPTNFPLASDVAQTYYGITPFRTNDALRSWTNALNLAHDQVERDGVYLHIARIETKIGHYDEARRIINTVTNSMYAELKDRLIRSANEREADAKGSNAVATTAEKGTNAPASETATNKTAK